MCVCVCVCVCSQETTSNSTQHNTANITKMQDENNDNSAALPNIFALDTTTIDMAPCGEDAMIQGESNPMNLCDYYYEPPTKIFRTTNHLSHPFLTPLTTDGMNDIQMTHSSYPTSTSTGGMTEQNYVALGGSCNQCQLLRHKLEWLMSCYNEIYKKHKRSKRELKKLRQDLANSSSSNEDNS